MMDFYIFRKNLEKVDSTVGTKFVYLCDNYKKEFIYDHLFKEHHPKGSSSFSCKINDKISVYDVAYEEILKDPVAYHCYVVASILL